MKSSYILAFITIFLWGSTAAISSLMLDSLSTLALVFYGSLTATCFLLILNLVTGRLSQLKEISGRGYTKMFVAGMLGIFLYNVLLFFGMTRILAQQAFIINYLWPIFIVIFSCILLKERLTWIKSISMLLSFAGVAVVATGGNFSNLGSIDLIGVLACCLAALFYGLFSVLTIKINCDKFVAMMVYYFFSTIVSAIALFASGSFVAPSSAQIPGILWMGVLVYGVAFTLWSIAIAAGNTSKLSNLAYLTPFVSLIWIYFLLGEPISTASVIGLLIIISGVVLQMFDKQK